MRNRDDFTKTVKELLAKRVGYRCSNPGCRRITIGANSNPNKDTSIGVAAHICAAAPGGPRYDESMTKDERKAPDNGIWLCQSCSVLIDKDEIYYSVELLKDWKRFAEEESFRDVNGNSDLKEKIDEEEFDYDSWENAASQQGEVICDIIALIAACRRQNSWDNRSELKLFSWLNDHDEKELSELSIDELLEVRQSVLDYYKLHIEMDKELLHVMEDDFVNDNIIFDFIKIHPGYTCEEIAYANRITIAAAKNAINILAANKRIVEIQKEKKFGLKRWIKNF